MKTHTLNQIESHRFQPTKNMPSLLKRALVLAGALAVMNGTLAQAPPIDNANTGRISTSVRLGRASWARPKHHRRLEYHGCRHRHFRRQYHLVGHPDS